MFTSTRRKAYRNPRSHWVIGLGAALGAALALCAPSSVAMAQGAHTAATNIPGVSAFLAPPEGFDAVHASSAQLQQYGFPPRPGGNNAAALADWEKMASAPVTRIMPTLEQTQIYHGPRRPGPSGKSNEATVGNITNSTSSNWSGYAITSSNDPFTAEEVLAQYSVPPAQQAFGTCNGGWDYGSAWVGVDGFSNGVVFQAGIEFDAYCGGDVPQTLYSTWFEWYPNGESRISNFPIDKGDLVRVYIWNTNTTTGETYIVNYTKNAAVGLAFSAPSGYPETGNSVEWIVERPGVSGGLATLTNYVSDPWTFCEAFNYTSGSPTYYYPGSSAPANGSVNAITMLDNSSNAISYAELQGNWDLWFYDEGSAY